MPRAQYPINPALTVWGTHALSSLPRAGGTLLFVWETKNIAKKMQVFGGCWYLLSQAYERYIMSFIPVRFIVLYNSMVVSWQACLSPYQRSINTVSRPYQYRINYVSSSIPILYPFDTPSIQLLHNSYLTPINRSGWLQVFAPFRWFRKISQKNIFRAFRVFRCWKCHSFSGFSPFSHVFANKNIGSFRNLTTKKSKKIWWFENYYYFCSVLVNYNTTTYCNIVKWIRRISQKWKNDRL